MTSFYPDLWSRLQSERRDVVLYGMGDGADKILRICARKGIPVRDVFASDDFVRGQLFHGRRVLRWAEIRERYPAENLTVLLAFASSRPEVLQNIRAIAAEARLYVPDVPVCGDGLFDATFVQAHREELDAARSLLCDGESRRIFDLVLRCRLTGELAPLLEARSDPAAAMRELIRPAGLRATADLGAYTGDTVRELLDAGARPEVIYAMEPDAHSFRRLAAYAAQENRTRVLPVHAAAWDREETLCFAANGSRGAAVGTFGAAGTGNPAFAGNARADRPFGTGTAMGAEGRTDVPKAGGTVDTGGEHDAIGLNGASDRKRTTGAPAANGSYRTVCADGANGARSAPRSDVLLVQETAGRQRCAKTVFTPALPLDVLLGGRPVDYIKYDVEGAEAQALAGSEESIRQSLPTLLVSLYHRSEDLFALPLLIHRLFPGYHGFYLRRFGGVPAWDLNLYVRKEKPDV